MSVSLVLRDRERELAPPPSALRDTVSRCGVFCALLNSIECCKTEGTVDVFQMVKALRIQKPGAVATLVRRMHLNQGSYVYSHVL